MDNLPTEPQQPIGTQLPPVQPIAQPQPLPSQPIPTTLPPQPEVITQPVNNSSPVSQPPKSPKKLIVIVSALILLIVIIVAVSAYILTRPKSVSNSEQNSTKSSDSQEKDNSSSTSSDKQEPQPQPELGILYDVPNLMNKTKEEVYVILGEPNNGNGWYNYDNNWAISVYYDIDNGSFRYVSVTVFQDPDGIILDEASIYKALNLTPGSTEYIFNNIKRTGKSFISQVDIYPLGTTEEIIRQ